MDPKVAGVVTDIRSFLTGVQTNPHLRDSDKNSFLSTYNSRINTELESFMNSIKERTDAFVRRMEDLKTEIMTRSASIPSA